MKKILAAAMAMGMLAGCGEQPSESGSSNTPDSGSAAAVVNYSLGINDKGFYEDVKALDYPDQYSWTK